MRREIKSIDVLSAGKVGCLWGALVALVFGCLAVFLPIAALPTVMASLMPEQSEATAMLGGGLVTATVTYLGFILLEGIALALIFAVGALLYNIVASLAGGLVIDEGE